MYNRGKNSLTHWNQKHIQQYGDKKPYNFEAIRTTKDSYFNVASNILKENKDEFNNKSLLDIGCSNGSFCAYIKSEILPDFKVVGSDFSPSGIQFAKEKANELGLDIEYEERDFLLNPIDTDYGVITMFEVLEHTEEGVNYKILDNLLNHCEYLILSVPNTRDDCFGEHISHYEFNTFTDKGYDVIWKAKVGKIDMSNVGDFGEYFHFITLFNGKLQ